jgi:outer membrane protein OmpA-like peptidoglycan-associated protein
MKSGFTRIAPCLLIILLTLCVNSFAATYNVIAPKIPKKSEKKLVTEVDLPSVKTHQPNQPDLTPSNPCPNETDWLLSTVPLTSVDKSGDEFSRKSGSTFLPENLQKELLDIAVKENISLLELCGKLNKYKNRLEEYVGDPQEYNRQRMLILEEMLDCSKSCGKILNKFAGLYTESSKMYFAGIVRFNVGSKKVENIVKGDKSQGYLKINNEDQLNAALARWQKDQSQRIQLDARASIPGATDINDRISRIRAEAVLNWLTERGVPAAQISIRWLGKYGPLINQSVASAYKIEDVFEDYKKQRAKQSTSLTGSQGIESFFDGINQSVCIFVLP